MKEFRTSLYSRDMGEVLPAMERILNSVNPCLTIQSQQLNNKSLIRIQFQTIDQQVAFTKALATYDIQLPLLGIPGRQTGED